MSALPIVSHKLALVFVLVMPSTVSATPQKHIILTHAEIGNQPLPAKKSKQLIAAEDKLLWAVARVQMAKAKAETLNVDLNAVKEKAEHSQVTLTSARENLKLANEKAYADAEAVQQNSIADTSAAAKGLKSRLDKLSARKPYNHVAEVTSEINDGYGLTREKQTAHDRYQKMSL